MYTPSYRILLLVRLTASFASPFLYPVPCHASDCMGEVTPTPALLSVPSICISAALVSALKVALVAVVRCNSVKSGRDSARLS